MASQRMCPSVQRTTLMSKKRQPGALSLVQTEYHAQRLRMPKKANLKRANQEFLNKDILNVVPGSSKVLPQGARQKIMRRRLCLTIDTSLATHSSFPNDQDSQQSAAVERELGRKPLLTPHPHLQESFAEIQECIKKHVLMVHQSRVHQSSQQSSPANREFLNRDIHAVPHPYSIQDSPHAIATQDSAANREFLNKDIHAVPHPYSIQDSPHAIATQDSAANRGFLTKYIAQGYQANHEFLAKDIYPLSGSRKNRGFLAKDIYPFPGSQGNLEFLTRDICDVPRLYSPQPQEFQLGYAGNGEFLSRDSNNISYSPPARRRQCAGGNATLGLPQESQGSCISNDGPINPREYPTARLTEQTHSLFFYSPLPEDKPGSIRLIRYASNNPKSFRQNSIYLEMKTTDPRQDQLDYICLSYCWGDAVRTRSIFVTERDEAGEPYQRLSITENLHSALVSLESSETHANEWMWIDMISINQNDLHERSNQVAMMKAVYDAAKSVIVWLGDSQAAHDAHLVITPIFNTFLGETGLGTGSIIGPEGLKIGQQHLDVLEAYAANDVLDMRPVTVYEILARFFSLPWFRRVWVLQEASLNRIVTVRIGRHTLPFEAVIIAALWQSFLTRSYTSASNIASGGSRSVQGYLPELWLDLLHSRKPQGLPMVELVCRVRDFEATDPRDKIFALLGLANDIPLAGQMPTYLHPTYNKPKGRIYMDFAKGLITDTGFLDILSAVDTLSSQRKAELSVSWMPRFDVPIATIRGLGFPKKYDAAFGTKALQKSLASTSDHDLLSLSGFIIDTVGPIISSLIILSPQLRLQTTVEDNAVMTLWTQFVADAFHGDPITFELLRSFVDTLTAAGFASSGCFPEHPLGQVRPPQDIPWIISDFAAYWAQFDLTFSLLGLKDQTDFLAHTRGGDADQFAVLAGKACHERKFFFTKQTSMGLCPRNARPGDKIVVLYGGSVPYVLRPTDNDLWTFFGECYVDGMMFGEAQDLKEELGIEDHVFHIR